MNDREPLATLQRHLTCPSCHAAGAWLRLGRSKRRQNSVIHRFRCARCGDRVVAKVVAGDGAHTSVLHSEYVTLRALQPAFASQERLCVLEPVGYFVANGCGIMVTRLFTGHNLRTRMRTLDAAGIAAAAAAAAGWLRVLHATRGGGVAAPGTRDKLEYLTDTYGSALLPDPRTRAMVERLRAHAPAIERARLAVVPLHGDFTPENVLCDGQTCVGVDIHLRSHGAATYDLAPFLNHLWLAGRGLHRAGLGRHYPRAEAAFLESYGTHAREEMHALAWVELYYALCQIGGYRRRGRVASWYGSLRIGPLARLRSVELERFSRDG